MQTVKTLSLSFVFSAIVCMPALADQCSYIKKEQALLGVARLDVGQTLYKLCEPCGETRPKAIKIKSLSAGTVNYENFWQVKVNQEGIDLAYVFVPSGTKGQAINLAKIAGCPARNVSNTLKVQ